MNIRRATTTDRDALFDIWLRSVRATHAFLSEEEVQKLVPAVRDYLASTDTQFWVLTGDEEPPVGFMGLSGSKMESLFLLPDVFRRGYGRALVKHAQALHGEINVDVNEHNEQARAFYEACGFVVEGRSELDDAGRPFPLLHLRLKRS
jgi:putative acetyltransferase